MAASALVAVIIASLGVIYIVRTLVVRPLKTAVTAANRLAEGDLTAPIEVTGSDEIGQLLGAMKNMHEKLRQVVDDVKTVSGHVGSWSQELSGRGGADVPGRNGPGIVSGAGVGLRRGNERHHPAERGQRGSRPRRSPRNRRPTPSRATRPCPRPWSL